MTTAGQEKAPPSQGKPISILTCPNCGAKNRIAPSEHGAPHCSVCGKPLPWVVDANEATFDIEAKASPTVVVDLWAPWCGPCRIVSPMLDEMARESGGRLKVVKVNVDENPVLAQRFSAMSIPTMVVMKDGQVVHRVVGALPKPQLEAQIKPHLKPPKSPKQEAARQ